MSVAREMRTSRRREAGKAFLESAGLETLRPQRLITELPRPRRPAPEVPTSAPEVLPQTVFGDSDASERLLPSAKPAPVPPDDVPVVVIYNPKHSGRALLHEYSVQPALGQPAFVDKSSGIVSRFEKVIPILAKKKTLVLLTCILLGFYLFCQTRDNVAGPIINNRAELDNYFHHLNFTPDQVLVYQGEALDVIPRGDEMNDDECIVVERIKKNMANGKAEIGVVTSNEHLTFPGSLLLANQRLVANSPDTLAVARAPLTYTVNLPGLTSEGSFTIVPSFSEYQASVNSVINTWFKDHGNDIDGSTAANFHSIESFAYSRQLLRVQFGLEFIDSVIESDIDFNAVARGEKSVKIYKFTQTFYTVSVQPPENPSDLFDPGVTLDEIKQKTNEKSPPVLVDSVSYGRTIYAKVETSTNEKQADLDLKTFFDIGPGLEVADDLAELEVQFYVIGGSSNQSELIKVKEITEMYDVITKFSQFSKNNLAYPISYSSLFINDNQKAIVHLTTDYIESVRHDICQKGVIQLISKRWSSRWQVTWTKYSYDEHGNKTATKVGWARNMERFTFGFTSEDIEIPGYVRDLTVFAQVFSPMVMSWYTVIDRSHIPIIKRRLFYIYGDSTNEIIPPIE